MSGLKGGMQIPLRQRKSPRVRANKGCRNRIGLPAFMHGANRYRPAQALSNPTRTTPLSIAKCTNSACEAICSLFFTRVW